MSITTLQTTDTFRTWLTKTNEIIAALNGSVITAGATVYGVFVIGANANTNLTVANSLFVNTSIVSVSSNATFTANVVITSAANVVNISAKTLLLQSSNGTIINSGLTVNADTQFLGGVSVNNSLIVTGNTSLSNLTVNTMLTTSGPLLARQVLFAAANAMLAPSTLNNPIYNDYTTSGLEECSIVNLTPGIDTVFTGITQPSNVPTGGRLLYLQNMSTTYKITLVSANSSSGATSQFKTPNDSSIELLPGAAVALLWTTTNKQWRVLSPPQNAFQTITVAGLSTFNGNVSVNAVASFAGNVAFGTSTLVVNAANGFVGVGTSTPTAPLHVVGNTILNIISVLGAASFGSTLTNSANASLANAALVLNSGTLNAVFANTITASAAGQSYIKNLKANSFVADGGVTLSGGVTISGTFTASLNASALASGTIPDARFPATLPAISGTNLTGLSATQLSSGTIPDARFPSTLPAVSGASLTGLSASALASGTIPDARFPATLPAISGTNLTGLNAGNLGSGTVPLARLAGITTSQMASALVSQFTNDAGYITTAATSSLNASNLTSGTVPLARLSGITTSQFSSTAISQWSNDSGYVTASIVSSLNAGNLSSGTVPLSRLAGITTSQMASALVSQFTNDSGYVTSSIINSLNASNLSSGSVPRARVTALRGALSAPTLIEGSSSFTASTDLDLVVVQDAYHGTGGGGYRIIVVSVNGIDFLSYVANDQTEYTPQMDTMTIPVAKGDSVSISLLYAGNGEPGSSGWTSNYYTRALGS